MGVDENPMYIWYSHITHFFSLYFYTYEWRTHVPNPLFCVFAICSVPPMHKEQKKVTQMCTLYLYVYCMHILDCPPSDLCQGWKDVYYLYPQNIFRYWYAISQANPFKLDCLTHVFCSLLVQNSRFPARKTTYFWEFPWCILDMIPVNTHILYLLVLMLL